MNNNLLERANEYLTKFCVAIDTRLVGKEGNREATKFAADVISQFGFKVEQPEFDCMDWTGGAISLTCGDEVFDVSISPYSLGCNVETPVVTVTTIDELERVDVKDRILFMKGDIAKEQLMPKNFVFYNPDEHKKIISLLEEKAPAAIIAATSRNPEVAGGVYPFPLIEDGDFHIPSAFMTDIEGERLSAFNGRTIHLTMEAERKVAKGYNVLAGKGNDPVKKIVVCAHIDAKMGTPGAIDNATGVILLLLLAQLLENYSGDMMIELLAFNGEDFYSVPGQMHYLANNSKDFPNIKLVINIDGVGYVKGDTVYSKYICPESIAMIIEKVLPLQKGMKEGKPWYQGDHSIFIQNNVPAVSITSEYFLEAFNDITHTPKDNPGIVDTTKIMDAALALHKLLIELSEL